LCLYILHRPIGVSNDFHRPNTEKIVLIRRVLSKKRQKLLKITPIKTRL
jgi:hypothetical protein